MSIYLLEEQGNYSMTTTDSQNTLSFGNFETSAQTMNDLRELAAASYALLDREDI